MKPLAMYANNGPASANTHLHTLYLQSLPPNAEDPTFEFRFAAGRYNLHNGQTYHLDERCDCQGTYSTGALVCNTISPQL